MTNAMDTLKKAKFSAERDMYARYAEKEKIIFQFQAMLNLSYDACLELYKMLEEEVKSWIEITQFSFTSIWEPSLQHAQTMMVVGTWNLEDWKDYVRQLVMMYQTTIIFPYINMEDIEEIEWQ